MNEDKILKLLNSTNWNDVLLGIVGMTKLENPRDFFRKHSKKMDNVQDSTQHINKYGSRYEFETNCKERGITTYHKIRSDFYILTGHDSRYLSECYSNYNQSLEVIDYEYRETI